MSNLFDLVRDHVEPGDYVNIDELTQEFKNSGFDADYVNVRSGLNWWWAILTIKNDGEAVEVPISFEDGSGAMVMGVYRREYLDRETIDRPVCPLCGKITDFSGEFLPCCGEEVEAVRGKEVEWITFEEESRRREIA